MTDPFQGIPDPSEHFLDILFAGFDSIAHDYSVDSIGWCADLARVLRPSVLDEYREWIHETWDFTDPPYPPKVDDLEPDPDEAPPPILRPPG